MSACKLNTFAEKIAGIDFACNVLLARHTTFGVGGPADVLVRVKNEEELARVLAAAHHCELPVFVMGGGSNILVSDDGFRGVVVQLAGELQQIKPSLDKNTIVVGAGASFPMLTRAALNLGWEAALGWCGTPGQVGGALKMNAGSRLGEIGEVVTSVYGFTPEGPITLRHAEIGFQYRQSAFPAEMILTKAELFCPDERRERSPQELLDISRQLAQKRKATQPKFPSAGSIFKNPKNEFAGRLIEACGLKGASVGGALVSEIHANFIVNTKDANAFDIFDLTRKVREEVYQKFDVLLEHEVKFIGEFHGVHDQYAKFPSPLAGEGPRVRGKYGATLD